MSLAFTRTSIPWRKEPGGSFARILPKSKKSPGQGWSRHPQCFGRILLVGWGKIDDESFINLAFRMFLIFSTEFTSLPDLE
jgi:hypothetical protein